MSQKYKGFFYFTPKEASKFHYFINFNVWALLLRNIKVIPFLPFNSKEGKENFKEFKRRKLPEGEILITGVKDDPVLRKIVLVIVSEET